jgi:purine-nucleoside phosphorylase
MDYERQDYEKAVEVIRQYTDLKPEVGLVLGSGLGGLANQLEKSVSISYKDIPKWPTSTVHGHQGKLVVGYLEGKCVVCQQGRAHFYEGYSLEECTFPIRVMKFLGVKSIILTNAAGGLDKSYQIGDIMMLNDHINFLGMSGMNPLMGNNDDSLGPRFPGMSHTYDKHLRDLSKKVAAEYKLPMREGVYVGLSGPFFETPAEVRMLRVIGGDAAGMSTVNEVLVARHMGLRVLAFSGITNSSIDELDSMGDANHEEVLEAGMLITPRLIALVRGVLRAM